MRYYATAPAPRIIISSCQHIGNAGAKEDKFAALMEMAGRKNIPVCLLGDCIEAVSPIDKRFQQDTHQMSVGAQQALFASYVKPARKQLITMLIGNHEDKLNRVIGNVTNAMLQFIYGVPRPDKNGTGACHVKCGNIGIFLAHSKISFGRGTSDPDRDEINRQVKLRRYLSPWQADAKIVGHAHQALVAPPVTTSKLESEEDGEHMRQHMAYPEWCAVCPSFFGSYDRTPYPSYGEMSLFAPNTIGWLELVMDHKRNKVVDIESHII